MEKTFTFGGIKANTSKKSALRELRTKNCKVYSNSMESSKPKYLIITDKEYSQSTFEVFEKLLKANNIFHFDIVFPLNISIPVFKDEDNEEDKGIIKFCLSNQNDWRKEINTQDYHACITIGSGLYSVTMSNDLFPNDFFNIHSPTKFFAPDLELTVYPICMLELIFDLNITENINCRLDNAFKESHYKGFTLFQLNKCSLDRKSVYKKSQYELIVIPNKEEFKEVLQRNTHQEIFSYDTETSSLIFNDGYIGCLTFSFDGYTGYYVNWKNVDLEYLNEFFKIVTMKKLGANLKFDIKFLLQNKITNATMNYDAVVLGHVLNENRHNSIKSLAWVYTDFGGYDKPLDKYISSTDEKVIYTDVEEEVLIPYATLDPIVAYKIHEKLLLELRQFDIKFPNEKIPAFTLEKYYNFRVEATDVSAHIEFEGIYIDKAKMNQARKKVKEMIIIAEKDIKRKLGPLSNSIDIGSQVQLGEVLRKLKWPCLGKRKDRDSYITNDDALELWNKMGYSVAKDISNYRSLKTILATFLGSNDSEGIAKFLIYHEDGTCTIHPTYNVMGADTGRSTCKNPNWQQIPSAGELAMIVRSIIACPSEDYVFVTADFASLQIRLGAIDSMDPYLYNIYTDKNLGADVHSSTAYNIFSAGKEYNFVEVISNGTKRDFYELEEVETKRGPVLAKDLVDTDELL